MHLNCFIPKKSWFYRVFLLASQPKSGIAGWVAFLSTITRLQVHFDSGFSSLPHFTTTIAAGTTLESAQSARMCYRRDGNAEGDLPCLHDSLDGTPVAAELRELTKTREATAQIRCRIALVMQGWLDKQDVSPAFGSTGISVFLLDRSAVNVPQSTCSAALRNRPRSRFSKAAKLTPWQQ